MVNAALVQAKVAFGYAKAAAALGEPFAVYRPTNPLAPLASIRTTLPAAFNARSPDWSRTPEIGKATWWGVFDRSQTLPGDYLIGTRAGLPFTAYVADQATYEPTLCVRCERTINVELPQTGYTDGANGYSGTTPANSTPLLTGWPASIVQGGRGESGPLALPGDMRLPGWAMLLPALAGTLIPHGAIVTDDIGRSFNIVAAEPSPYGWRIAMEQADT